DWFAGSAEKPGASSRIHAGASLARGRVLQSRVEADPALQTLEALSATQSRVRLRISRRIEMAVAAAPGQCCAGPGARRSRWFPGDARPGAQARGHVDGGPGRRARP